MSSPLTGRNRMPMLPAAPPGRPIATFRTYLEAQKAVDYLSDEKFPVRNVSIVGTDLKMVERVTGRLTYGRVALGGFFSGAYFGGFVGLILALFDSAAGMQAILPAILIGAAFGVIFAVISYTATGGRRDFTSTSQIVAAQYAVWCADDVAADALRVLNAMPGASIASNSGVSTLPVEHGRHRGEEPEQPATPEPASEEYQPGQPVSGPTYSEMLAKKRAQDKE